MLVSLLVIIVSLIVVVGLHEVGHALSARLFNIKITKIAIGFGKPLLCWQGKNHQWIWAVWPFGGYVRLLNSRIEPVLSRDYRFCFDKKPAWQRCIVLLAGAFVNCLTAWLALVLMLMLGYQQTIPIIANVTSPSIAATAGLAKGDHIISLAGQNVFSWRDVGMQLILNMGKDSVEVVVENKKDARHVSLNLTQWKYKPGRLSLLTTMGIAPDVSRSTTQKVEGLTVLPAFKHALLQILGLFYFFLVMIKQLLTGVIPFAALLGPLGFFTELINSFLQGFTVFLYFISTLSVAVALVNLLPLPGLDGGSIVYTLIEKIRGKPISIAMEILLHRLMFIVFCLLLVQLLLNDIQRYNLAKY